MLWVAVGIGLAFFPTAAYAKEGSDQYPYGAENWFAGATPPPGFYYINYFGYYNGQLRNGSGGKALLNGKTASVDATFNASRFLEMTHFKIVGADYGVHVIVPIVHQSVDLSGRNGTTGLGDITIDPLVLGWHGETWHAVAAFDINLPTGVYDRNDPRVSIGANYYSFEPVIAVSYLPRTAWEGSIKVMYNLKTTNPATNYHSGQDLHFDYLIGRHFRSWMLGASGYGLKQTTADTANGQIIPAEPGMWDAGREGCVFAAGPSIGYRTKSDMTLMVQWQHEALVENRFAGDKVWFKVVIPAASVMHRRKA